MNLSPRRSRHHRHRALARSRKPFATTRIYLHADMKLKENAIARTAPPGTEATRYKAPDTLLAFLDQL